MDAGIDYGLGQTNIDKENGIRYGVISSHSVGQSWYDDSVPDYGSPMCPECQGDVFIDQDYGQIECSACHYRGHAEQFYPESPISYEYMDNEYLMHQGGDDTDIFVLKSPYYTRCAYCSPCAPGAGYLEDSSPAGIKAYCLGPEWFENDQAPYPVYRVSDDSEVQS